MIPRFLFPACLFIVAALSATAQTDSTNDNPFADSVNKWMKDNNVPAVGIGIIENGTINYIKVFGELKKGSRAPNNAIFNIASITKPVVATMALTLVNNGDWNLDEPLFHYFTDPDVMGDSLHKKLTTRHVLTHQSGFNNWRFQRSDHKLIFEFPPGTRTQYSGEGFVYLCRALEKKFNKTLPELMDSLLFKPLGMKDTWMNWNNKIDESRFAAWHNAEGALYSQPTPESRTYNAAGSMMTTIGDLCTLGIHIINHAGLDSGVYADMITAHAPLNKYFSRGLGWEIISDLPNVEYALEHGGSDNGVKSIIILLPKSRRGIVVLTNGDNGMVIYPKIIEQALDIGWNIFDNMAGRPLQKTIQLTDHDLQQYTGVFLDSYGRELTIQKSNQQLVISGRGVPTVNLHPSSPGNFFIDNFDIQFHFTTFDSLKITANGKLDCTAKRIK